MIRQGHTLPAHRALQVPSPDPFYTDLTVELVQHVRQTQPSVKDVALRQLVLRVITDTIRNDALPEYSSRLEVSLAGKHAHSS